MSSTVYCRSPKGMFVGDFKMRAPPGPNGLHELLHLQAPLHISVCRFDEP